MSKLCQILLPVADNSGRSYTPEHAGFCGWLLDNLGGYTVLPDVRGAWRKNGVTFYDTMRPYNLSCTEEKFSDVLVQAATLFNDQHTFFVADIGDAQIVNRDFALQRLPNLWENPGHA